MTGIRSRGEEFVYCGKGGLLIQISVLNAAKTLSFFENNVVRTYRRDWRNADIWLTRGDGYFLWFCAAKSFYHKIYSLKKKKSRYNNEFNLTCLLFCITDILFCIWQAFLGAGKWLKKNEIVVYL